MFYVQEWQAINIIYPARYCDNTSNVVVVIVVV